MANSVTHTAISFTYARYHNKVWNILNATTWFIELYPPPIMHHTQYKLAPVLVSKCKGKYIYQSQCACVNDVSICVLSYREA